MPETFVDRLRRLILGMAFILRPKRLADAPFLALATLRRLLKPGPRIPDRSSLLPRPKGYGGPVHDSSPAALLAGMRNGFYLMSHCGPLKWWAPPERAVMSVADVHVPRRFRRAMRGSQFTVTIDQAFDEVVLACAAPRRRLHVTWLHPSTRTLMHLLHREGYAHSVEVRDEQGELVGGVFGVALGPVFSALSMFHTTNDASKLAIVSLYHHLASFGVDTVDHQQMSPWLEGLGGRHIAHAAYEELLRGPAPECARPGRWTAQFTAAETAAWQPGISRDAA